MAVASSARCVSQFVGLRIELWLIDKNGRFSRVRFPNDVLHTFHPAQGSFDRYQIFMDLWYDDATYLWAKLTFD